ncbi:MAG: hypothetical protein COB24_03010 [Hyphomicrobiales bacterium]|nr:MAG: hypothetical protein COB24_03010 [Hyphomicrobiales bacterium]
MAPDLVDTLQGKTEARRSYVKQNRYTEEFKRDAVAQITDGGYSVRENSDRLGISTKSLYYWRSVYSQSEPRIKKDAVHTLEIQRLKSELARVTEERDILKKAMVYFAKNAK